MKIQIKELSIAIKGAIDSDKKIFMMGNGGSSAPPSHSAGDYSKELGARTICLSDNISAFTALANDTDYSNVFKGQLEVYMDPGDIVITEFFYNESAGNLPEYVELFNSTDSDIDLNGWKVDIDGIQIEIDDSCNLGLSYTDETACTNAGGIWDPFSINT